MSVNEFGISNQGLFVFVSSFPRRRESRGGGRLLHGKTSWTLYYDYAKQDNEKTLWTRQGAMEIQLNKHYDV